MENYENPYFKQEERVPAELITALREKKREGEISSDYEREDIYTKTPSVIIERANQLLDDIKKESDFHSTEAENKIREKLIKMFRDQYTDPRFEDIFEKGIITDKYLEIVLEEFVDRIIDREDSRYEDVSLLVIDVNGLKAVNDNFSREEGDKYLKKIIGTIDKSRAIEELKERGVGFEIATAGGGDEFYILIEKEKGSNIDTGDISNSIKKEIWEMDMEDVIDCKNLDFKFLPSVSVGEGSFIKAATLFNEDSIKDLSYQQIIKEIRRVIFAKGHNECKEDKDLFKELLKKGEINENIVNRSSEDQKKMARMLLRNKE